MTLNTNPRQYFTILGLVVVLIVLLSPRQAATAQSGRTVYLPLVQKNYKTLLNRQRPCICAQKTRPLSVISGDNMEAQVPVA